MYICLHRIYSIHSYYRKVGCVLHVLPCYIFRWLPCCTSTKHNWGSGFDEQVLTSHLLWNSFVRRLAFVRLNERHQSTNPKLCLVEWLFQTNEIVSLVTTRLFFIVSTLNNGEEIKKGYNGVLSFTYMHLRLRGIINRKWLKARYCIIHKEISLTKKKDKTKQTRVICIIVYKRA